MGFFAQMTNASFKVNDQGETLFWAPLFYFWDRRAYVLTSDDDVERLKQKLRKSHWVFFVVVIPLMVFVLSRVFGLSNIVPMVLWSLVIGAVIGLSIRFAVLRPALRNLERSSETMSYGERWDIQAASCGWGPLLFFCSFAVLMTVLGVYQLASGRTALGICVLLFCAWIGLHHAYLMALKRRQAPNASPVPES